VLNGISRTAGTICAIRDGRYYFPLRLIIHSAIPASMPSTTSGKINSREAPIAYAITANAQHEPTTHNAIAKDSGSLSMRSPLGRCSAPSRPVGVVSTSALEGEPYPRCAQDIVVFDLRASRSEGIVTTPATCWPLTTIASDLRKRRPKPHSILTQLLYRLAKPNPISRSPLTRG
jgi:hypothetical protein